jgi:hypothetical protein
MRRTHASGGGRTKAPSRSDFNEKLDAVLVLNIDKEEFTYAVIEL